MYQCLISGPIITHTDRPVKWLWWLLYEVIYIYIFFYFSTQLTNQINLALTLPLFHVENKSLILKRAVL
jgi:hypothetical protein